MSSYSAPLEKLSTFCNTIFEPKKDDKSDLQVKSLVADSLYGTNTAAVNLLVNNINLNGGNHINFQNTGGSFSNYNGMIWEMSGDGAGSQIPNNGSFTGSYRNYSSSGTAEPYVIGRIDATNSKGWGVKTIGNGFINENATQYNTSTGNWTCRTRGKYLIQVNIATSNARINHPFLLYYTTGNSAKFEYIRYWGRNDVYNYNSYTTFNASSIIDLSVDDTISIRIHPTSQQSNSNVTFTGEATGILQEQSSIWKITRIVG